MQRRGAGLHSNAEWRQNKNNGEPRMNLAQYLEQHAAASPDRAAIRFEGRTLG